MENKYKLLADALEKEADMLESKWGRDVKGTRIAIRFFRGEVGESFLEEALDRYPDDAVLKCAVDDREELFIDYL